MKLNGIKSSIALVAGLLFGTSVFAQTYTFTNCGVSGSYGPTQTDVNTAYTGTSLDGMVTINTQGIQEWTVPVTGTYTIQAIGATAGNQNELTREVGHPANMNGDFFLTAGSTLKILVGQHGFLGSTRPGWGAGGGTFVAMLDNTPLIVAGGCGAVHTDLGSNNASTNQNYASLTNTGQNAQGGTGTWTDGYGATGGQGGDGAGYYGNGTTGNGAVYMLPAGLTVHTLPQAFVNGGNGDEIGGGFGGGGGVTNTYGGGGGGYSGGQGGVTNPWEGGGGASYNAGANQSNYLDANNLFVEAHGLVVITSACAPTAITPDIATLSDVTEECSSSPAAPTASNDCGATIPGTPDVTFPITTLGTTTVTWTYDDGAGNVTSQTQSITITDNTAPVPDAANLPDLTSVCGDSIFPPTATDACMGTIVATTTAPQPYTVSGSSTITWTFDDGNGNVSTQTQNVNNPVIDNTVTQTGSQLSANQLVAAYQWLDCDNSYAPIGGEVNQYYTPSVTGNYAVEITVGGCADTSACILVDFTGIDELNSTSVLIYPNPSIDGFITIEGIDDILEINVVDMLGRAIALPIDLVNGIVDGSTLQSGKYMVEITSVKGRMIQPIVVLK